jgi:hypothetical protein
MVSVLALLAHLAWAETAPGPRVTTAPPATTQGTALLAGTSLREFLSGLNHVLIEDISPEGDLRPAAVLIVGPKNAGSARPESAAARRDEHMVPGDSPENFLDDPEAAIRRWAVERLGEGVDGGALVRLTHALHDDDAEVRTAALAGLEQYGVAAVGPIESRILHEPVLAVRVAALEVLARIGEVNVVSPLKELLNDHEIEVRVAAVAALGQINSPLAVQALLDATRNRDPAVRMTALDTLALYASEDAAEAAIERGLRDGDGAVAALAADLSEAVRQRRLTP